MAEATSSVASNSRAPSATMTSTTTTPPRTQPTQHSKRVRESPVAPPRLFKKRQFAADSENSIPNTPHRPRKRQPFNGAPSAKKCLDFTPVTCGKQSGNVRSWTDEEVKALVEFVLLMCDNKKWPTHHRMHFWSCAGEFIQSRTCSRHLRSGSYMHYASILFSILLHSHYTFI